MRVAILGGSGIESLPELEIKKRHDVMTVWGKPSTTITAGILNQVEVLFLPRHGLGHSIPPHKINYRAHLRAIVELGAEAIIATTAVGGIEPGSEPGAIVIPHQLIDYTYGREHTYFDDSQGSMKHIDFTEPYSSGLRQALIGAAGIVGLSVRDTGTYGSTQGPRLETAAEIHRLALDGCTIVGMTGMPEAALARELGVDYANISLVVNRAAGCGDESISMASIGRELTRGADKVRAVISTATSLVARQSN